MHPSLIIGKYGNNNNDLSTSKICLHLQRRYIFKMASTLRFIWLLVFIDL